MTSLGRVAGLLLSPATVPDVVARVARGVATAVPDTARTVGAALPATARSAVPGSVAEAAGSVGAVATRLARLAGLTRRRVWSRDGRHHIEVHGVCQDGGDRLARQVEAALEALPGVAWARVNAPSGRVVVAVEEPKPKLRDLIATVARTERVCPHEPDPEIPPPHPPEEGPRTPRAMGALASDALGLTISAATRILPFTPVPGEVAGALAAVDLHPKLHALADRGLRADPRAELLFPLAEAVVQGLTGGWAGIVLDGAQRVVRWGEAQAQLAAWTKAEPRLTGDPDRAVARVPDGERPCPVPDGPAERYVSRMLAAGAAPGRPRCRWPAGSAPPRWPCRRCPRPLAVAARGTRTIRRTMLWPARCDRHGPQRAAASWPDHTVAADAAVLGSTGACCLTWAAGRCGHR
ncbi:hypothetical protein Nm8I071_65490 [Nonomuraea sp. TT08I-71]|nr:hypothetical protein Nm8I071_65490 [Nonomuraea sp. TT08I-71]